MKLCLIGTFYRRYDESREAIKAVLSAGKGRLADVVEKSGLTEEVVSALLTEANGFYKNQQGWYGTVK